MAKYLARFTLTDQGLKGLIKEGGSRRRQAVQQAVEAAGGRLEAFYFAFGESDGIVIVDGVQENMIALLLGVGASGAVRLSTTVLITPEEMDHSVKKIPPYRPPGS